MVFCAGVLVAIVAVASATKWYRKAVSGPVTQADALTKAHRDAAVVQAMGIAGHHLHFLPFLIVGLVIVAVLGAAWAFGWVLDAVRWLQVD